ncbi:MAG: hypothetical protein C4291_07325, partial [Candidatus Dadabacteria bacterium]
PPDKPFLRWIRFALGYVVALLCLGVVFHGARVGQILQNMTAINWWWVALAVICDILGFVSQGFRWQLLLRPIGNVSVIQTTQAIYAGLFISEVLPMRFGELARAYLISRWISAKFSSTIPSIIIERLFDGIWMALAIGLTAIFVPLPRNLVKAGDTLGIIVLVFTGLFIYVVFRKRKGSLEGAYKEHSGWKPIQSVMSFTERMDAGLRNIGMSPLFYVSFGISIFILVFQALAFWLAMLAYGLSTPFWVGVVVFLIVHLGTVIPNAPANVGTYQFFCVVGLTIFGIEKTLATGFSVVVFVLLTIPLWIIGFFVLSRSGTTLYAIRSEVNTLLQRTGIERKNEKINP